MSLHEAVKKILITSEELETRIKEVAKEIEKDYDGKKPILLCLLKGSVSYFAHLCENIDIPMEYEFLRASSYHGATSTGDVKVSELPKIELENRHIIVVEDIIDTGLTLSCILETLKKYNPASIEMTTLLDKPARRLIKGIVPKYVGFEIPDEFVIGFGLDFNEEFRNLPYIGVLKEEFYK